MSRLGLTLAAVYLSSISSFCGVTGTPQLQGSAVLLSYVTLASWSYVCLAPLLRMFRPVSYEYARDAATALVCIYAPNAGTASVYVIIFFAWLKAWPRIYLGMILTVIYFTTVHMIGPAPRNLPPPVISGKSVAPLIGGGRSTFSGGLLRQYVVDSNESIIWDRSKYTFEFQCPAQDVSGILSRVPTAISVLIPVQLIYEQLTRQELIQLSKFHKVWVPTRTSAAGCRLLFAEHECDQAQCNIPTIFKCVEDVPDEPMEEDVNLMPKSKTKRKFASSARQQWERDQLLKRVERLKMLRKKATNRIKETQFPPRLLSFRQTHRVLSNSCNNMRPQCFVEAGCAVCGCLVRQRQLSPLENFREFLHLLERPGVTRRERIFSSDPFEELSGPILAEGCDKICVDCETALVNKKVPKNALALHNWVGEVPPQLRDLTFAERIMIARVRHNRCVIRVNSGRMKMNANVIMFSQPVLKVYNKLPPSRDEMHEILAFIFTGSAHPTQEDFDRTPLLVRRCKVLAALEWLKLNHELYIDLEISRENLETYAERDIPVTVDFRRTNPEPEDSVPLSAGLPTIRVRNMGLILVTAPSQCMA